MRNLLQDADRDRLVAPLATGLRLDVAPGGRRLVALAEQEGARFAAAEGNARAAELLLMPGLRESQAALSDGLLDFVMAMAEAPVPCRRAVAGAIELRRDDPRAAELLTPFFRLTADLSRGALRQEPPASGCALRHTGNLVEFFLGRHRTTADVEDAITAQSVTREGGRVVLTHTSTIRGRAGLFRPREVEAGTLTCRYEVAPDSPLVRLTVSFTASRRVGRLRVTTALDALAEEGLGGTAGQLRQDGAWRAAAPAPGAGPMNWADGPPVEHVALGAAGWPAGAPAVHLHPEEPGRVMTVTAESRQGGSVHWLLLRHGPADLGAGQTLTVRETRLLAPAGGDVAAVAAAMAAAGRPGMAGLDLDPAPVSGAALQAVATALMFDAAGAWATPLAEARRAELLAFAARQAARLEQQHDPAETAGAVIGLDALRRAGLPAEGMARMVARLLGLLSLADGVLPGLAAQAQAVLALARAATWPDGGEAAAALPGLLEAVTAAAPGAPPGLGFAGMAVDVAAEAEAVALLCRAAGAVVLAGEAGAELPAGVAERARELHRVAVTLLRPLVRPRIGMLEVLARGAVTPGLQALVTLAFLAPERLVFRPSAALRAPA